MEENALNSVTVSNGEQISLQLYQQIYSDITGKTENLRKWYDTPYEVKFSDIENVYDRLKQHLSQYNVTALSSDVKIYYYDDSNESFSSFERFKSIYSNSSYATTRAVLTINFSIIHFETKKPQNYKISLIIDSPIADKKKEMEEEAFYDNDIFFIYHYRRQINIDIEYVDYNVARTTLSVINDWTRSLTKAKINKFIIFLQKYSKILSDMFKYIIISAILVSYYLQNYENTAPFSLVVKFLCTILFTCYTAYLLGAILSKVAKQSINRYSPLAYINFSRADEELIKETQEGNKNSVLKFNLKILLDILISVTAATLIKYLPLN